MLPSDCEEIGCRWRSPDNCICRKPIDVECPMDAEVRAKNREQHMEDYPEDARARKFDGGF